MQIWNFIVSNETAGVLSWVGSFLGIGTIVFSRSARAMAKDARDQVKTLWGREFHRQIYNDFRGIGDSVRIDLYHVSEDYCNLALEKLAIVGVNSALPKENFDQAINNLKNIRRMSRDLTGNLNAAQRDKLKKRLNLALDASRDAIRDGLTANHQFLE